MELSISTTRCFIPSLRFSFSMKTATDNINTTNTKNTRKHYLHEVGTLLLFFALTACFSTIYTRNQTTTLVEIPFSMYSTVHANWSRKLESGMWEYMQIGCLIPRLARKQYAMSRKNTRKCFVCSSQNFSSLLRLDCLFFPQIHTSNQTITLAK